MMSTMKAILRRGMSVNLYMFHGGSSFGFMSGAFADPSYKALVPSYGSTDPVCLTCHKQIKKKMIAAFLVQESITITTQQEAVQKYILSPLTFADYDAPLSEAGDYTPKYHLIRDLLSHHRSKLSIS